MKLVIALAILAAAGAIGGALCVGARLSEPTVVADPYQRGLHYDEERHARDVARVDARAEAACDLARGPCATRAGRALVTLELVPRPPRAMRDLEFRVSVQPPAAAGSGDGSVALEMLGMYMGENRVALRPAGEGAWRGQGVVVRCPSGRRTWRARVALPPPGAGDSQFVEAAFTFDVAE